MCVFWKAFGLSGFSVAKICAHDLATGGFYFTEVIEGGWGFRMIGVPGVTLIGMPLEAVFVSSTTNRNNCASLLKAPGLNVIDMLLVLHAVGICIARCWALEYVGASPNSTLAQDVSM